MEYIDAIVCRDDLNEISFRKVEHDIAYEQLVSSAKKLYPSHSKVSLKITKNLEGKPFGEVITDKNTHQVSVSLSHRFPYTFSVISTSSYPLGCDVEAIQSFSPLFMNSFLTDNEKEFVTTCAHTDKDMITTMIWACKEAFLKAEGAGFRIHPKRIEVLDILDPKRKEGDILKDGKPIKCNVLRKERTISHVFVAVSIVRK